MEKWGAEPAAIGDESRKGTNRRLALMKGKNKDVSIERSKEECDAREREKRRTRTAKGFLLGEPCARLTRLGQRKPSCHRSGTH